MFQNLVFDVVIVNNQDVLGDHDTYLSSDSIDINESIDLTQIHHNSQLPTFFKF